MDRFIIFFDYIVRNDNVKLKLKLVAMCCTHRHTR